MSLALRLADTSSYLGHRLMTTMGMRVDRRRIRLSQKKDWSDTAGYSYLILFAGLRD